MAPACRTAAAQVGFEVLNAVADGQGRGMQPAWLTCCRRHVRRRHFRRRRRRWLCWCRLRAQAAQIDDVVASSNGKIPFALYMLLTSAQRGALPCRRHNPSPDPPLTLAPPPHSGVALPGAGSSSSSATAAPQAAAAAAPAAGAETKPETSSPGFQNMRVSLPCRPSC